MQEGFYKDGKAYAPELDKDRLKTQHNRIFALMCDGKARTLREINESTGAPEASASACLRDFRKPRFGSHIVLKKRRGDTKQGLFEYWLILNREPMCQKELF